jgi:hypothetical protein
MESILDPAIRWIFVARILEMAGVEGNVCIFPGAALPRRMSRPPTAPEPTISHRSKNRLLMSVLGHLQTFGEP